MGKGWQAIASFIIRRRIPILIVIAGITVFLWLNRSTEISYDFAKIIPSNHPDLLEYKNFKKEFGEDGNVMLVGLEGNVFSQKSMAGIYALTEKLAKVDGITQAVSITRLVNLVKDTTTQKFRLERIVQRPPQTQEEADSLKAKLLSLPFYKGLFWSDSLDAAVIGLTFSVQKLDSKDKIGVADEVVALTEKAAQELGLKTHFSGLPYIRAYTIKYLPREMAIFFIVALLVTGIVLFLFFRSLYAVIFPMIVVGVVVMMSMGILGLLHFKITHMIAVLPALITVIGIPNSIYILTKYHFEYRKTQNKMKSLMLVIQKIGIVTVMTNATTAVGFAVLIFTKIEPLQEFGIVAGLSILTTFVVSVLLIPIFFSFLPPPSVKQTKHIDARMFNGLIRGIDFLAHYRRKLVYFVTIMLVVVGAYGLSQLETVAHMVDDLPKSSRVHPDLHFLENKFNGVMPFEIVVNTRKKEGIFDSKTLKKIDRLQTELTKYPELSRSISILDLLKFGRQGWLNGSPEAYMLPTKAELREISSLMPETNLDSSLGKIVIFDSLKSKARIKANIGDVGSIRLAEMVDSISVTLSSMFVEPQDSGTIVAGETYKLYGNPEFVVKYDGKEYTNGERFKGGAATGFSVLAGEGSVDFSDRYKVTGTTEIFIKSNEFLVNNLIQSLILGFLIIALLMALLFGSFRMVLTAMIPNMIPLLITAGVMGFLKIPLKPSTALIFSVAFGIAVDDTIHYLARYRLARKSGISVGDAVSVSFKDTGLSMIYTSVILFFGFGIFIFSGFGSIVALGQLTSITLAIALATNLVLLPALLISLHKNTDKVDDGFLGSDEDDKDDIEAFQEMVLTEDEQNVTEDQKKI